MVTMLTTKRLQRWVALLSSTAFMALACGGVKNPDIQLPGDGGEKGSAAGSGGKGGTDSGGSAGAPELMAGAGMGGSPLDPECTDAALRCDGDVSQLCEGGMWVDQETCPEVCVGEGVCSCDEGTRQCSGDTPQLCEGGAWVDQAACGGTTKVCTGEGVCASFRLLGGGIGTFGPRPAESGNYVLKEQTLSAAPRACNSDFCVTGGL